MIHPTKLPGILLASLALLIAGCSGGGDSTGTFSISSVVQDLTVDPNGLTTVVTFDGAPLALAAGDFAASGGQSAASVSGSGSTYTVTWNARVTPSHQVRVIGKPGVSSAWAAVTASDTSAPTFAITDTTQTSALGGDSIEVTFSGPRVIESEAEDASNWAFVENGQTISLANATFALDNATQVLTITLGTDVGLHGSFTLAASGVHSVADVSADPTPVSGTATGDTTAPTLVSAVQNLTADEFGTVVDFTFSEAMDPVFSTQLTHFAPPSPNIATNVSQPSEAVLRVTFNNPVIPGVHTVDLTGLMDAHGNAFPDAIGTTVTQPSPVANAYDGNPSAVTVENVGGDYISIVTTQAFDATSAEDFTNWSLVVDSVNIDLSTQTFTYDFPNKTLRIDLDFDLSNGTGFTITPGGVLEVDGQTFSTPFTGTVSGDSTSATVTSATQNRNQDGTGKTVDVVFSEDVDQTTAETAGNYTISGGTINVVSATRQASTNTVRLVLDAPVIPGDYTLTVAAVADIAGNVMGSPQSGIAIGSTDTTAPTITDASANAIEGVDDDTVVVTFSDDMITSEVQTATNWAVESPVGTSLDVTGATVSYDASSRTATLVFDAGNGLHFKRGDDFQVSFSSVRDLGGNTISATPFSGNVSYESNRPSFTSAWVDSGNAGLLHVRFSEPCDFLDDLYDPSSNVGGTRYELYDGVTFKGWPTGATVVDGGLGVDLTFGVAIQTTWTLDLYGVEDLAGNFLIPQTLLPIAAEDPTTPGFSAGASTVEAISGENNDIVTVAFDVPMSPWGITDPANFTVTKDGTTPLDLSGATFEFDGLQTLQITFGSSSGENLQSSSTYDLAFNNLRSSQGVLRTSAATEAGVAVSGDLVGPTVAAGAVRIDPQNANSLLVFSGEALDQASAETAANYDYNSGTIATSAIQLAPRVVRVTFPSAVAAGFDVTFSFSDLARNSSGALTRTVAAADSVAPLIAGVQGYSVSGVGGDYVTISYDEPVTPATGLDLANYTITNGGSTLSLSGSSASWDSSTLTVTISLADGVELDPALGMQVTVRNVADWSGNAIAASGATTGGTVVGDSTAPGVDGAFVNWRENAAGRVVDVQFGEDVDTTFAGDVLNWSASGGQTISSVQMLEPDYARVTLATALGSGDTLSLAAGLTDPAGNQAGALSIDPDR